MVLAGAVCSDVSANTFHPSAPVEYTATEEGAAHDDAAARTYVAGQVNPWLLPQSQPVQQEDQEDRRQESAERYFQEADRYSCTTPMRGFSDDKAVEGKFVTPDVLEGLKRQQMQYQVMPENRWKNSRSNIDNHQGYGSGNAGGYYPVPGPDPLYDTPMAAPWGNYPDVLYRGQQFPMIPGEALGGFPPVHVSPYGMGSGGSGGAGEQPGAPADKVFNPFTFLPDYGSQ